MDRGTEHTKDSSPRQLRLPIEHTPESLRRRGLAEAHRRPLAAWGKRAGVRRVAPEVAWTMPLLQMVPPQSWPLLTLDLDGPIALQAFDLALAESRLPRPTVVVTREATGNKQVSWFLRDPVHRYDTARPKPQRMYGRISEYYAARLWADPGFHARGIQRSPLEHPHRHALAVDGPCAIEWMRDAPFTLHELNAYVETDYRRPARRKVRSDAGRNCAGFFSAMRYAGSPRNIDAPILPYVEQINPEIGADFGKGGLRQTELQWIAYEVERYRSEGFARPGHPGGYYDHSPERQADRGRRSGRARRSTPAYQARLARVVALAERGMSHRAIGREVGMRHPEVGAMLTRWMEDGGSLTLTMAEAAGQPTGRPRRYERGAEPWKLAGVSRRTWYRRGWHKSGW